MTTADLGDRHRCAPPVEVHHEREAVPRRGVGARWVCACGTVWIVRPLMTHHVTTAWFPESRREARKRLGLRWWQRLPRVTSYQERRGDAP